MLCNVHIGAAAGLNGTLCEQSWSAPVLFCKNSTAAPATKGTAWDVPERYSVALSDLCAADRMSDPGAQMSTHLP